MVDPKDIRSHRPAGRAVGEPDDVQNDAVIGTALKWSAVAFVTVAAIAVGMFLWIGRDRAAVIEKIKPVALPEVRSAPAVEPPAIPFKDVTAEAGIAFAHENGAAGEKLLPETMGGGCGFFDFDSDGDQDILLVNSRRWDGDARPAATVTSALYENDGTGHYKDVTAGSGLDVPLYGMGCAFGDYDGDGDPDVYLTAVGTNRLFRNEGGGKFVDVTDAAGVGGPDDAYTSSAGWFDYDDDGDLDLMAVNYVVWSRDYDLAQNFQLTGGGRAYGRPQAFEGTLPLLFRNEGDGKFVEVAGAAGLQVKNPNTGRPMAKSLGLTFADFDSDGDLDVLVANDTVQNFLFENRGDGTFIETGASAGVAFDPEGNARGAMGLDVATLREGRAVGVAVGNFANEPTALYVTRPGELSFTDEAYSNGLGPQTRLVLTFGVLWLDADLDGRPDLFCANGHLEEDIRRVQPSQTYEQSPQLFWNAGPEAATEFVPLGEKQVGADFLKPAVGRGAAYADIDGDGDLDLLIATAGRSPRLLRNDQSLGRKWLRVKLVGAGMNTGAIGATVRVVAGGRTQERLVNPTRSYLSQVELPATFGLGEATAVERVEVRWPTGLTQTVETVTAGGTLVVREGE